MENQSATIEALGPVEIGERLGLSRYTVMKYYRDGTIRAWLKTKKGTPLFRWDWVTEDLSRNAAP